jgi:glycerophosphoryl diester phosphodiesterase
MKIIGHRGAAALAPENSLEAIRAGLAAGADGVEIDVQRTHDDELVVIHDDDLQRLAGRPECVRDLTLSQLLDTPLISGAHLLSLDEALEAMSGSATTLFIEGKHYGWARPLRRHLAASAPDFPVSVISFNVWELARFHWLTRRKYPGVYLQKYPLPFAHLLARLIGVRTIGYNYRYTRPGFIMLSRRLGFETYMYTVDSPELAKACSKMGVSYLATDDPAGLRAPSADR